jgi:hypothetical protein
MRSRFLILGSILLATCVYSQQAKPPLEGKLVEMDSTPCGAFDKYVQHNLVEVANTIPPQTEPFCPEYVLQADQVTYRIVSSDAKHPAPLPVGESALFRLQNGKMLVRVPAFDGREREYIVVSATALEPSASEPGPIRLNHLQ